MRLNLEMLKPRNPSRSRRSGERRGARGGGARYEISVITIKIAWAVRQSRRRAAILHGRRAFLFAIRLEFYASTSRLNFKRTKRTYARATVRYLFNGYEIYFGSKLRHSFSR